MSARRIRVRIHDLELELEGDAEFIEQYRDVYEPLLDMLPDFARGPPLEGYEEIEAAGPTVRRVEDDLFQSYRPTLTDYDRVLIACYHTQQRSDDHSFQWPEVSRVLVAHGMSVADAASEFQYLMDARQIIKLGKQQYRISPNGVDAIHKLMTVAPP